MKFWIAKNSEVSVREQIVTQITVGIAGRDLLPGEKLPSTREFARRFGIHANTVSAAYRELVAHGLVDRRKGSGVFVASKLSPDGSENSLDRMLADLVAAASAAGFTRQEIGSAMTRWIDGTGRRKLVLVESDPGLRRILQTELHVHAGVPADAITLEEFAERAGDEDSVVAALFDEREKIRPHLSPARRAVFIEANSVPHSLVRNERPGAENLIAVVTCWAQFAALAKVYLVATGIEPEALMIRRTEEKGWDAGLGAASVVICDSAAATRFGDDPRLRVFRLIPDSAIDRIKQALL